MVGTQVQQYRRMLDLAMSVLAAPEADDPWPLVLRELADALRGSIAVVAPLWDARTPALRACAPGYPDTDALRARFESPAVRAHPHLRYYAGTVDSTPRTMSDLVGSRAWSNSPLYHDSCADFGAVRQIAAPIGEPARRLVFAVGRPGRDFTQSERDYLRRLQPLLNSVHAFTRQVEGRGTPPAVARHGITARELVVLGLLADGLTAETMARRLAISPRTVHRHLERVYRKLSVRDRLGAVLAAQEAGLLRRFRVDAP